MLAEVVSIKATSYANRRGAIGFRKTVSVDKGGPRTCSAASTGDAMIVATSILRGARAIVTGDTDDLAVLSSGSRFTSSAFNLRVNGAARVLGTGDRVDLS